MTTPFFAQSATHASAVIPINKAHAVTDKRSNHLSTDKQSANNSQVNHVPMNDINASNTPSASINAINLDKAHIQHQQNQQPNPPPFIPNTFIGEFMTTLAAIFKDKGVLLMLVIAPILYGFFYPWPYSSEVVSKVPVGIVDNDHSNLSQTLVRYSSATPQLNTQLFLTEQDAKKALWQDKISGYMVIPSNTEKNVKSGKSATVSVIGNGDYFLLNKNIQTGFLKAVGTVSAGIEVKKSVAKGAYQATAKNSTQAIPLRITPLYNQTEGYGAYVVPGVAILILQQTLLMGAALLIGTFYERRRHLTTAQGWLGRIFALSVIGFIMGCFYYGWVFEVHHYARGANLMGSLVFLALFMPAVATLGCFLGLWFGERERALQILIVSSLPLFFLSGYPWPIDQLPQALQLLRWLIPTSAGINTSVQLNQMGASLTQVMPSLMVLIGLMVFYFIVLLLLADYRLHQAKGMVSKANHKSKTAS